MNTIVAIARRLNAEVPHKPAHDYPRVNMIEPDMPQLAGEMRTLGSLGADKFIYEVGKSSSLIELNETSATIKPISGKSIFTNQMVRELQEEAGMTINIIGAKSDQSKQSGPAPVKTPGHHRIFDNPKGKGAGKESAPTKVPKKKI